MQKWRNWQTRTVQVRVVVIPCGFDSHLLQAENRNFHVPAYKVVNSQGVLSGAASFEHPGLQRILLEEEGIEVSMDNKVDLKKYGWKNSLEDAEFFRETFRRKGI